MKIKMEQPGKAIRDALRATRLGSLKYDRDWLDTPGKVQEVLALCNQFDRTLTFTAEEQRIIATSPKAVSPTSVVGLGGHVDSKRSQKHGIGSMVFDETDLTPSSVSCVATDSAKSYSTVDEKREESFSAFELKLLQFEKESEELLKATYETGFKSYQAKWEEYKKQMLSAPTLPRSLSPVLSAVPLANNEADNANDGQEALPVDSIVRDYGRQSSPSPPLSEIVTTDQYYEHDSSEDDEVDQRPPSRPSPVIELAETPEPIDVIEEDLTSGDRDVRESADDAQRIVEETPPTEFVPERNDSLSTESVPVSRQAEPPVMTQAVPERLPVTQPPVRPIATPGIIVQQGQPRERLPSSTPTPERPPQRDVPVVATTANNEADPALAHIHISPFDISRFTSTARMNEYKRVVAGYQRHKESCERVQERLAAGFGSRNAERSIKAIRQELSNLITTTINLVSKDNIKEPLVRLGQLLNGDTISFQSKRISVKKHQDAPEFSCELIARTLKQAENVVGVQRDMAYPLALVAVCLWVRFPRVGDFLKAIITSKCTFLVPYYPPRAHLESEQDFLVKLGYIRDHSGEMEKQPLFLKRITGICRFWAAIMCTPAVPWNQLPTNLVLLRPTVPHPMDFHVGWAFLVNSMQISPRPDITATILFEFLSIASHFMKRTYGRQFEKLLRFMNAKYLPEILAISPGSVTSARLKSFFDSGAKRFQLVEDFPKAWSRCV